MTLYKSMTDFLVLVLLSAHIVRFSVSHMRDFLLELSSLKAMVHMITVLTSIAHIDIGEYKYPVP